MPRKRVSKKKKEEENLKPEEEFIAFATNVPWIDAEKYAMRWEGIETGYRMIEKTRVKTACTGVAPRMIYFAHTHTAPVQHVGVRKRGDGTEIQVGWQAHHYTDHVFGDPAENNIQRPA